MILFILCIDEKYYCHYLFKSANFLLKRWYISFCHTYLENFDFKTWVINIALSFLKIPLMKKKIIMIFLWLLSSKWRYISEKFFLMHTCIVKWVTVKLPNSNDHLFHRKATRHHLSLLKSIIREMNFSYAKPYCNKYLNSLLITTSDIKVQ